MLRTRTRYVLVAMALGVVACASPAFSAMITFESPIYTTTGNLAAVGGLTGNLFNGQDGWAQSSSNDPGKIVATVTSGSYTGGQGLSTTNFTAVTYAGAKQGFIPGLQFSFDMKPNASDANVGGWTDANADGKYDQSEADLQAGYQGATGFGFRGAGYGTRFGSGVTATPGDWYHVVVTLNDSTRTATLDVTDLTTNAVVDLNGGAAGNSYSLTLGSTDYGPLASTETGVMARVGAGNVIDNITFVLVPEPTSLAVAGMVGVDLLFRRRWA